MNNFKRSKNLLLATFIMTLLHVAAASQVPNISGTWVSYDSNAVLARGLITIEQTGNTLTVTTPDKFKTTSVISNGQFVRLGDTGFVSSDGTRIDWISSRGVRSGYWVTKSVSDKHEAAEKAGAINLATSQLAELSAPFVGKWEMYNASGQKDARNAEIKSSGLNLTIDNGYGSISTAQAGGKSFVASNGLTGILSDDGSTITWSNNFKWKRLAANNMAVPTDNPALGPEDLTKVMEWLAVQVSAEQLPFCYRQSYARQKTPYVPAGKCISKKDNTSLVDCMEPCPAGKWLDKREKCTGRNWCPDGYADGEGGRCVKPAAYGRGAGYAWQFDGINLDGATARCEKEHGKENCEQCIAIIYEKCKPGFHPVGCNICSPDCPKDWADDGVSCKPMNAAITAYYAQTTDQKHSDSYESRCMPGSTSYLNTAGGCFESCTNKNDTFAGPTCFGSCPSQNPVGCLAGCAKDTKSCVFDAGGKFIAAGMLAINIATFGAAGAAESEVNGAVAGSTALARESSKLTVIFNGIKEALPKIGKVGSVAITAGQTVKGKVEQYQKEFSDNFALLTSDEIARKVDTQFGLGPAGRDWLKKQWGLNHLQMRNPNDSNEWANFKLVLTALSLEPTGIVSVVNAFLSPKCLDDKPIPRVTPLYTY